MNYFNYYLEQLEIKSGKLPEIFERTIYRLPTQEELQDIDNYKLSASKILDGFCYTIIGRGLTTQSNIYKIIKSIELLVNKYPNNEQYKIALDKCKKIETKNL